MMNACPFRQLWLTLLLGACAVGSARSVVWGQERTATLVEFRGPTTVRRAGTANYLPAESKMVLRPGDIVRTGPNAAAVLLLPNGSVIRLRDNGAFRIPLVPAIPEPLRARAEAVRQHMEQEFAGRHREHAPGPSVPPGKEHDRPRGGLVPRDQPRSPGGGLPEIRPPRFPGGGLPVVPGSEGRVTVRRSGTRLFVIVEDQTPLNPGDIVRTGPRRHALIFFADGSRIKLRENSALLIPPVVRPKGPGPAAMLRVLPLPPPPPPSVPAPHPSPQIPGGNSAP